MTMQYKQAGQRKSSLSWHHDQGQSSTSVLMLTPLKSKTRKYSSSMSLPTPRQDCQAFSCEHSGNALNVCGGSYNCHYYHFLDEELRLQQVKLHGPGASRAVELRKSSSSAQCLTLTPCILAVRWGHKHPSQLKGVFVYQILAHCVEHQPSRAAVNSSRSSSSNNTTEGIVIKEMKPHWECPSKKCSKFHNAVCFNVSQ